MMEMLNAKYFCKLFNWVDFYGIRLTSYSSYKKTLVNSLHYVVTFN